MAEDRFGPFKELDGIRAFSVITISLYHLFIVFAPTWNPLKPSGGYVCVDIFFTLSGFLITSLLIRERRSTGRISLKDFYRRRALRLFPALAIMVAVVAVTGALWSDQEWAHPTLIALPWVIFYVGNWNAAIYGGQHPLGALGHTWSLAVEEQFYLLWPLILVLVLPRIRNRRHAAYGLFALAGIEMVYRWFVLNHLGWSIQRVYFGTDTASDGLLVGAGLAFLFADRGFQPLVGWGRRVLDGATIAATFGILYIVMRATFFGPTKGLWLYIPATVVATAVILANMITRPLPVLGHILRSPPLVWIGKRSYGIYLWVTAIQYLISGFGRHGLGYYRYNALIMVASFVVAGLSYRFVETPFLKRKRKPAPAVRRGQPVAAADG